MASPKKKRLEEIWAQITLFDGLSVLERFSINPGRVYLGPTSHCVVLGGIGGLSKSRGFAFGVGGLIVLRVKIAVSGASLVATEYGACAFSSWRLLCSR